jgi:hypothetical protein
MGYKSYLRKETKLAGIELSAEDLAMCDRIFEIVDAQGHSGGSMGILNSYLRRFESPAAATEGQKQIFRAADVSDGLVLDAFQVLDGLSMSHATKLVGLIVRVLRFEPLSPLTGDDSEWMSLDCDREQSQNRRLSSVFRNNVTGHAYWLDGHGVNYPRPWGFAKSWHGHNRPRNIQFPLEMPVETQNHYYTDETLSQRVVLDSVSHRGHLSNQLLATSRGIDTTPRLNVQLEACDVETRSEALEKALEMIMQCWHELKEQRYPAELHHVLLSQLDSLDYREEDECDTAPRELYGVKFAVCDIAHISHVIAQLPFDFVIDGDLITCEHNGTFQLLPVMFPSLGFTEWQDSGFLAVRWVDDLNKTKAVYLNILRDNQCEEIAGDQDDWLWNFRRRNGLPHPERKLANGVEPVRCAETPANASRCIKADNTIEPLNGTHTDPADVDETE